MRDDTLVCPIPSKNHPISAWATTSVDLLIAQDGEFVVRCRVWEGKPFVIFILVGVAVTTNGCAVFVVAVTLLHSSVDVGLGIAG